MEAAQNDSVGFVSQTVSDIVELIEGKRQVDVKLIASPAFKLQARTGVVSPSPIINAKSSIRSKSRKCKGVGALVPFPSASRLTLQYSNGSQPLPSELDRRVFKSKFQWRVPHHHSRYPPFPISSTPFPLPPVPTRASVVHC